MSFSNTETGTTGANCEEVKKVKTIMEFYSCSVQRKHDLIYPKLTRLTESILQMEKRTDSECEYACISYLLYKGKLTNVRQ